MIYFLIYVDDMLIIMSHTEDVLELKKLIETEDLIPHGSLDQGLLVT